MYIYHALINALSAQAKFAIINRADATTPVRAREHYSDLCVPKAISSAGCDITGRDAHSDHRFPAPSLKEGCRKPVLGVWEGRCLPARADREGDVSSRQQRSVGIVSSGAPSDARCSAVAAVPVCGCCCCKNIVSEKCMFETVNRFAPASLHFAETILPSAAARTGTGRRFAATRNQHFS